MRNLIGIGIVAVLVIGGFIFRDFLSGNAAELKVGDCFDLPAAAVDTVEDVQHHPCSDEHQAEVFLVENYPGTRSDPFPSDDEMTAFITDKCIPAFNSYTGKDYYASDDLDFSAFSPIAEGWKGGDQEVTCFLVRVDLAKFKGSLKAG